LGFDSVVDGELVEQLGLETDGRGAPIIRDYATSVEGVFAAGDLVTGPSYVATAIHSARTAAERINQYLSGNVRVAMLEVSLASSGA
jgi:glutamate synthase (NADPH/NADH) small chain